MSDEQGVTEVGPGLTVTENTDLNLIPATEVKPEDVGTLSLRYVDGVPQLVVSGGTVLPAGLTVVDASGNAVAAYTAVPAAKTRASYPQTSVFVEGHTDNVGPDAYNAFSRH